MNGQEARARLSHAGGEFRRRWRTRRSAPEAWDRALAIGVAVWLAGTIAIVASLFDGRLALGARTLSAGERRFFEFVTFFGTSGYIFALCGIVAVGAVLARARGGGRLADRALAVLAGRAAFVFAVAAVSGLASLALKHVIGRARPRLLESHGAFHFVFPGWPSVFNSFPSGHAITAFACAAALGFFLPRLRPALYAAAALICVSRVALGSHYPSDVVAGAAIGWASAILLRRAFAARGLVFRQNPHGATPRAAGEVWPALRGWVSRSP